VGSLDAEKAKNLIDGTGLVLSPGFIDAHTHSDFNAFIYPGLDNKLRQGVTTEIVGNCGMSAAPVRGEHKDKIHEVWAREGVEIPAKIPWEEFKGYHSALEAKGLKTNLAALVGHGNLRMAVMGPAPRAATADEIKAMKKLLAKAMKQGAYGISYGLVYLPGIFAQEEELVELCRQAAAYSGVCAFHMRNEGSKLIEAVREALSIGEKSGGRIQISHLKAGGKENWGKIQEAFQLIEDARRRGVEAEADAYPYTAGFAELGVVLPDDIYQREDRNDLFEDRLQRANLILDLETYYREKDKDWDKVVIATTPVPAYRSYQGKSLKALAEEKNQTPVEVLVDLLAGTSFQVSAFYFSQSEEVVDQVLRKPYVDVGSDSIADGSPGPHPRAFGTFPKIVKKYVREKRDLEMGEAIRKMTSVPAEHFGLKFRGRIQPGYAADLVLFDPQTLTDKATYALPNAPSQGVKWVFVNGQPAIENGKMTFKQNGQVLLRHG
ncbi:MAG TPA: D-aminoacylase, partial [bacterium]|nr:D-aminoacylase [bacterium]